LRAAKTEILTVKAKKTDAEISVLAKQITKAEVGGDALSFEELMYSATLTLRWMRSSYLRGRLLKKVTIGVRTTTWRLLISK